MLEAAPRREPWRFLYCYMIWVGSSAGLWAVLYPGIDWLLRSIGSI